MTAAYSVNEMQQRIAATVPKLQLFKENQLKMIYLNHMEPFNGYAWTEFTADILICSEGENYLMEMDTENLAGGRWSR